MSLRLRLMVTFVAIILLVVAVMWIYQARLLESYFRGAVTNQLIQQGARLQSQIEAIGVPASNTAVSRQLAALAATIAQSRALVTDEKGVVLLDSGEGKSLVGEIIVQQLIGRTLKNGRIETFDFPEAGADSLALSIPWITAGRITGSLVLVRPLRSAAREAANETGGVALKAALLASAVAAVVAYFLSTTITDPLRKMAQAARSVSKGNFNEKVPVRSGDELGDLAEAMNSMSGEIAGLIDNLTNEKEKLRDLMDERTNMLSDISHDLRTPVTSIRGFVEALRDGIIKDEAERTRTLNIIHDESGRLSRLVDDLFYLARLESGEIPVEMTEVDLSAIVRSSVATAQPLAMEKDVSVSLTMDEASARAGVRVMGSSDRLTRAILNVLDNAMKYSPRGGQVKVSLKVEGGGAVIAVSDEGPGIAEEDIPHVFERFYRADKSRSRAKSGAGLGLSIARFIIEQHLGSIWVESVLGQGATFLMSVPLLA
jgi:signal transduction histidine kinase